MEVLSRRFVDHPAGCFPFHNLPAGQWSNDHGRPRRCSGESATNRCNEIWRSTLGERKKGIFGRWTPKKPQQISLRQICGIAPIQNSYTESGFVYVFFGVFLKTEGNLCRNKRFDVKYRVRHRNLVDGQRRYLLTVWIMRDNSRPSGRGRT